MTNILILYTGGTIGMTHDPDSGVLRPFDFKQVVMHLSELKKLNCHIDFHALKPVIDSSDMQPEIWVDLVLLIEKNYTKYDGFVILHGTDTMAYTSSALSFMLQNLSKPIVLTGSQLPFGAIRTDARRNLITAIEIAGAKKMQIVWYQKYVCFLTTNCFVEIAWRNILLLNLTLFSQAIIRP